MQIRVFGHQPLALGGDVLCDLGGGGGGLLLEGQHHAVLAVDEGEQVGAVVADHHAGNVQQADVIHALQTQAHQLDLLELRQGGKLRADADQIAVVAVGDVACGQVEVLGAEDGGDGLGGDDAVDPGVLQRLVAILDELVPGLGQLVLALAQGGGCLGEGALGLCARVQQLLPGLGKVGVLGYALDHAAGQNAPVELVQHGIDAGDAGLQLGHGALGLGVLRIQRVAVGDQQVGLVRVAVLHGGDLLIQCRDLGYERLAVAAALNGLGQLGDLLIQLGNARLAEGDLLAGLLDAALHGDLAAVQQRQGILRLLQRRALLVQRLPQRVVAGGQRVHIRLGGFENRLLGGQLRAQLLQRRALGACGTTQQQRQKLGRLPGLRRAGGVHNRLHGGYGGDFDAGRGACFGFGSGGCVGGRGGFGGIGGNQGIGGRGGGLGLLQRLDLGAQVIDLPLRLVAAVDGSFQLAAHAGELGLVGSDVALQRGDGRLQRLRIQ